MNSTYKTQKPLTADITANQPFYMVIRLGGSNCQQYDSLPTTRYDSEIEAHEEAERLAVKNPTHPRGFAVVKAISIIRAEVSIAKTELKSKPALKRFGSPKKPTK